MDPRPVRLGQALDLVSSLDDPGALRAALIGASFDDPDRAWAAAERYGTLESRLVDVAALEAELARLAAGEAARRERVWRHTAASLRALAVGDFAASARALVAAGEVEEQAGRRDAAERLYARALELGRKPRDRTAEGLALRRLGRVAKARGELGAAVVRYRQGYELADAQRDEEGMVVACQGLGNCHVDQGRWDDADRWYRRGLELLGERRVRERWQIESNLSIVARRAGDLAESERWLAEARRTVAAVGDPEAGVYLTNTEGLLRMAQRRLGDAEVVYRSALASAASPPVRATVLVNLAECLLAQGRVAESVDAAREAERLAIGHGLHADLPYVYLALGAAARASGDPEGLVFFEQALDLARTGESPAVLAAVQREYARLERTQGSLTAATARLREALGIFGEVGARVELEEAARELEELEELEGRPGGARGPTGPGGDDDTLDGATT